MSSSDPETVILNAKLSLYFTGLLNIIQYYAYKRLCLLSPAYGRQPEYTKLVEKFFTGVKLTGLPKIVIKFEILSKLTVGLCLIILIFIHTARVARYMD